MSASSTLAKIIRVSIKKDARGVYVATSPNLKGLLVVSKDLDLLLKVKIDEAIAALYEACGVKVLVTQADEDGHPSIGERPWIAVPMQVFRDAEKRLANG